MSSPRAELHQGVKWSMDYDPSTTGFLPRFVLSGPDGEHIILDGAVRTIDYVHSKVHAGMTYQISTYTGNVNNNDHIDFLLSLTGSSMYAHTTFYIAGGGDTEFEVYRGVTGSNYGSPVATSNLNDEFNDISTNVTCFNGPVLTAMGKRIIHIGMPGGEGGDSPGGAFRNETERVLRKGTRYYVRLYNRGGASKFLSLGVQWYEEEGNL